MPACYSSFHGHAKLLHISTLLFHFVTRGTFMNHGDNPACPAGDFSAWTCFQRDLDVGAAIAETTAMVGGLDSALATVDQIARASQVCLQMMVWAEHTR